MMNLFEIMQSAQNGQAMQNLARQYGLSLQQTQAAIDALLPAFSMGLQRQTQTPQAFGSLAQMMTASPYARFFEAPGAGIPPGANSAGNDVLSRIFGSQEVAQAIAAQAAATSGVSMAILKQMLPVIAAMLMGGLSKTASSEGFGGILGQFAEMMRGQMPGMQPAPQPQQAPLNPMDAILRGMFGQASAAPPPPGQTGAGPNDPFGGMFGQILGGMFGGTPPGAGQAATNAAPPPGPSPQPEPRAAAGSDLPPGPGSIGLDAVNQMFEHGRQIQDDHQKAMKSILDAMLGGGQPPR